MKFSQSVFRNIAVSLVLGFSFFLIFVSEEKSNDLIVAFLDVGQGDAIFIQAPTGEQALIDGGPDRRVLSELSDIMPWLDRSIDLVVATHPDKDHIGGLSPVMNSYHVDSLLTSGAVADTGVFKNFVESSLDEDAEILLVRRGSQISLGDVDIQVLFPEQVFDIADRNVSSVVVRVSYGEVDFLLTGDIGKEQERYIAEEFGRDIESEVLKLSHHGSDTSSDIFFLETVRPSLAIVSAAKNSQYGHPDPLVIDRVQDLGISIMSTQYEGAIVLRTDGNKIWQQ